MCKIKASLRPSAPGCKRSWKHPIADVRDRGDYGCRRLPEAWGGAGGITTRSADSGRAERGLDPKHSSRRAVTRNRRVKPHPGTTPLSVADGERAVIIKRACVRGRHTDNLTPNRRFETCTSTRGEGDRQSASGGSRRTRVSRRSPRRRRYDRQREPRVRRGSAPS